MIDLGLQAFDNLGFILLLGLLSGSFVGLCIYRLPRREPVAFTFSRCDFCARPLTWLEKVPILSYIMLRGTSRCCHRKISGFYPIIEGGTALLFAAAGWMLPDSTLFFPGIVFVGYLLTGAIIDSLHKIIPNKVTLSGIALALVLRAIIPSESVGDGVFGAIICGGYLLFGSLAGRLILRKPRVLGGGDIKFAAMIGAFLGYQPGMIAILIGSLAALVYGIGVFAFSERFRNHRTLPFGPFLALGALLMLFLGTRILAWQDALYAVIG